MAPESDLNPLGTLKDLPKSLLEVQHHVLFAIDPHELRKQNRPTTDML